MSGLSCRISCLAVGPFGQIAQHCVDKVVCADGRQQVFAKGGDCGAATAGGDLQLDVQHPVQLDGGLAWPGCRFEVGDVSALIARLAKPALDLLHGHAQLRRRLVGRQAIDAMLDSF